jgi:outer membrane biosynthesis protein TonB
MFDTIGRTIDPEAGRRRTASAGVLGLLGVTVAALAALGASHASRAALALDEDAMELVQIELAEPESADEAPPPPPPPPAGPEADESDEPTVDEADEMVDAVAELDEKPDTTIRQTAGGGSADGVEGGEPGGVPGGTGVAGGGFGEVRSSQIQWRSQVEPHYPREAEAMDLGEQRCRVRMHIDDRGVPEKIEFLSCPPVFHAETTDALMRWRAVPFRVGSERTKATFQLTVLYRQRP